ncbi:glycosyltransferase family protein [Haloarcula amylovorans]|uniref:glycosyltransferase family 39 protein n=1 Tax=Haloarcula amylovorans TaxID=2562280 RepID=UPI001430C444|nr:glycosyltransferase family 39 protein [Halomicroarcula amylolytica]
MSPNTTDSRWFDFRLDVAAAVIGLILGLLMVPLRFLASQVYIETIPIVLALACLLYLISVRVSNTADFPTLTPTLTRLLPSVAFLGMAAMVVVAVHQSRSLLFHYLAVWTGMVVLAQVVFADERDYHVSLLLAQVLVFGLVVRLAGAFTAPGYVGIDIWTHAGNWSPAIKEANSLAPINTKKYYASPLYHLLVAVGSQLLGVTIRQSLILTVGIPIALSTILVYATANVLVEQRWAVFAAAIYTLSGNVIEWGIHLIPTGLGLVFYIAIIYALTRIMSTSYNIRDFLLVVVFSVAVILTHQISSFIMLIFVGAGLVAKVLLSTGLLRPVRTAGLGEQVRDTTNLTGLLVFDLGLITFMWSLTPYRGSSFLETMLSFFANTLQESAGFLNLAGGSGGSANSAAITAGPTVMEKFIGYLDAMGLLLLLLITIAGSLYVLHRRRTSQVTVASIIAIVVMLVFIFGFPLFGIRTFVPGRWLAFVTVPMAIVGAIGVAYLASESPKGVAVALLLVFTLVYPPVTMLSSQGTLDDPAFDGVQTRYSYTENELDAVRTIANTTNTSQESSAPNDRLTTDHPYGTVFERAWEVNAEPVVIDNGSTTNETVVYREYAQSGAEYYQNGQGKPFQPKVQQEDLCRGYSVVYDNGDVAVCERSVSS